MKKPVADVSASVRQRLLNLATERKEDFGLVLTRYGLERFLYRLSVSPHRDAFVLKGALLLQVWTAEIYRPTRDLDLLGREMDDINFRKIFSEVCSQNVVDDGLTFLPDTIRVERIRDEEAYEGVRVRVEARLGHVRVPLQIDVGLGDTIVPASEELEYPTLLKFPTPKLHTYSKESVVAEKFDAMVKLGVANSRMKDFYDLWVLAQRFEFESGTLAAAIEATFKTRRTTLPKSSPLALRSEFCELPTKQTQWQAFLRKSGLKADSSLKEIIEVIREFVMPVVGGILKGNKENEVWRPGGPWRRNRRF
ncbi:MAG: nucleotidyl transferase AbiEii/AbiGii toxin family protein [Candidatus Sulfotelmatobacter sp.]